MLKSSITRNFLHIKISPKEDTVGWGDIFGTLLGEVTFLFTWNRMTTAVF